MLITKYKKIGYVILYQTIIHFDATKNLIRGAAQITLNPVVSILNSSNIQPSMGTALSPAIWWIIPELSFALG